MKYIKILSFLLMQVSLTISLNAQSVSEYVKTNHYTYKCAYCKAIKKEDKLDIASIKNPKIANNASTYAMASAMFGSAFSSGSDICDISRTGRHRYELVSKTVTKELYTAKKENNTNNSYSFDMDAYNKAKSSGDGNKKEKTNNSSGFDYDAAEKAVRYPSNYSGTKNIFIKSAHGNYFIDHRISDMSLHLADQPYDRSTGAYSGELWEIVNTVGGKIMLKSAFGNYFLNHRISDMSLSLVDQPYNPSTGAYSGVLWEIIDAGGGKSIIKSTHGNFFIDHRISDRSLALADRTYNPSTGAYSGVLWEIVNR
jgi:hypothetical protein